MPPSACDICSLPERWGLKNAQLTALAIMVFAVPALIVRPRNNLKNRLRRSDDVHVPNVNCRMADRRGRSHIACCLDCETHAEVALRSLRLLLIAFVLNLGWEMTQMFTYAGMTGISFRSIATCSVAAIGDALYVLVLYWAGYLISGDRLWFAPIKSFGLWAIAAVGFVIAVILERVALFSALWQYAESMPRIPLLQVGVWPVLQLMTMPVAAFWIASRYMRSDA